MNNNQNPYDSNNLNGNDSNMINQMNNGSFVSNQQNMGPHNFSQPGSIPSNPYMSNQPNMGPQNFTQGPQNFTQDPQNFTQAPQNFSQGPQNFNNQGYNYSNQPIKNNNGNSGMGIAALILSILGCTFLIGGILAIIDLNKKDGKNKTLSKVALGICGAWIFIGLIGKIGSGNNSNKDVAVETTKEVKTEATIATVVEKDKKNDDSRSISDSNEETSTDVQEETKEEAIEESSGSSKLGVGDEFGNKTITGVVTYADLDYKDYNDVWLDVQSGQKVVFIKIKVTNISDNSNYVSVGDFDCYVDDISTSAEVIGGSDLDYNANIEAGRSAVLGAAYIVPEDSKCIELEYRPLFESSDRQIIVISDENTADTIIEADDSASDIGVGVSKDINVIGVGDEFGNKTITGVVEEVNLNYTGYNSAWTEIPEGKKAIYIKIKVTNISEESNYVSVGDFDCYVDDVIVSSELVSGSNDDYNANIESGRSAILGAMYVIPTDANSIELEYTPIGESAERVIIKIQ